MCMLDNSDGVVTTISDVKCLRARIQHKCKECLRVIARGESYYREVFVWEGVFNVHKTCAHCMVVRSWLQDECGGWLYGGVEEDAREHICNNPGHYGIDLHRAVVGMSWNWRTRSGRLLPVPRRIKTSDELRREAK